MVNNEGLAATDQLTDTKLGSKLKVGEETSRVTVLKLARHQQRECACAWKMHTRVILGARTL